MPGSVRADCWISVSAHTLTKVNFYDIHYLDRAGCQTLCEDTAGCRSFDYYYKVGEFPCGKDGGWCYCQLRDIKLEPGESLRPQDNYREHFDRNGCFDEPQELSSKHCKLLE